MIPSKNNIQKMISSVFGLRGHLMKSVFTLMMTLLSHAVNFTLTRPWLSGVTVVCSVLAVMVLGYGPKMNWKEKSDPTDHYFYVDEGFVKKDDTAEQQNKSLFKKFESNDTETVELIQRRPEFNGPRFTKRERSTPFDFTSHQTTEHDSQRDTTMPPVWSQQANSTSKTQSAQKPIRVIGNNGSIMKASASESASSAWLIGIIEEETEPQPTTPKEAPVFYEEGPMIIQGNRK